jgi:hypothetical protein
MTLFLYPVDQAVARSTRGVRRTSRPALAVVILELVVLVAVVATAAAVSIFGVNFLVLTNSVLGSTLPAGSLVVTQVVPAESVATGDLVTIAPARADGYVTGRVLDVQSAPAYASTLTLAVDEQTEVAATYTVAEAQRVLVTFPNGGYFLATAAQPMMIGFALLIGLGLMLQLVPPRRRNRRGGRSGHRSYGGRTPHAA